MRVESGARHVLGKDWSNCLMLAAGTEPFALVDRAMALAGRLSGALHEKLHLLLHMEAGLTCCLPCTCFSEVQK